MVTQLSALKHQISQMTTFKKTQVNGQYFQLIYDSELL